MSITPGPWKRIEGLEDENQTVGKHAVAIAGSNDEIVCFVLGQFYGEAEGDIRIIEAANDMYQVLKECKKREYNPFEPDNQSDLYNSICKALAKARGE